MRVPLAWLAEWIELPEADTLAERLTLAGLEVEEAARTGPDLSGVRVGRVTACGPHPRADRLSLCRVEVEPGREIEVVCGAPNVAVGQKVAVALPGARLPDGTRIRRSKIRGVESAGMICSERELGLGDDANGILVLDPDAPVGAPLDTVVGANDTVLEIALTPNRGDCASLLGVAREVRAHFGGELRLPPCQVEERGEPAASSLALRIEDGRGCRRYVGRLVRGVRVGPSPVWLRRRLEAAGLRSIDNVVDVTNLVLLEFGQPLHAFDAATLRGAQIVVRAARPGEKIVTLDGQARELAAEDLVIADAERAVAIAGVMGGAETQVGPRTRDVLIESAQFDPLRVRRTARRLGLATEASYRFERGVDPAGVRRAADRAARLIAELAGGEVAPGALEARGEAADRVEAIELEVGQVNRLLATELSAARVGELLGRLEIEVESVGPERLRCRPPSYRHDLAIAEDLIEEVARLHGYDRIPARFPSGRLEPPRVPAIWRRVERARDCLRGLGLVEAMTFPFVSAGALEGLGLGPDDPRRRLVRVENPLSEEENLLRSTLAPSLLALARRNLDRQVDRLRVFEVARVFRARGEGELPDEPVELGVVLTGGQRRSPWEGSEEVPLFFAAKGIAERLLEALGFPPRFRPDAGEPFLHPHASAAIEVDGTRVGAVGEVHPRTAAAFELSETSALVLIGFDALEQLPARAPRYRPVSRHPSVRRDLALLVPREVAAEDVRAAIERSAGPHLVSVLLFDRYQGGRIPADRVSLAFRLVFQHPERTLREAEVARALERVLRTLRERFGGELRSPVGQEEDR